MKSFSEIFPADVVAVQGKPYLFTNARVDRETIPKGFHTFDVRDDSCDGEFWEIQKFVRVDHWGTIIGLEPIELDERGQFWCDAEEGNPEVSSEGAFLSFTAEDQAEYVVWYHSLKKTAIAVKGRR